MNDFSVRSENVDVEQIMRQIRARIREKRGVDYTEDEIRELANVKLEKFLDPKGVRSDLLQQYRHAREASLPPNYAFEDTTLFETHRGLLRFIRRLLNPILKLFFNPAPLIEALHIQSKLNESHAAMEPLQYELMHNLVIELTRASIEVQSLKMRVESMASRLDFDERRARALEGVVQYRAGAVAPMPLPQTPSPGQSRQYGGQPGQSRQGGQSDRQRQSGQPRHDGGQPRHDGAQGGPPRQSPPGAQPQPGPGGPSGPVSNELDADGNERRARRRRRRGRRRPGEFGGPSQGPDQPGVRDSASPGWGSSATRDLKVAPTGGSDSAGGGSTGEGGKVAPTGGSGSAGGGSMGDGGTVAPPAGGGGNGGASE